MVKDGGSMRSRVKCVEGVRSTMKDGDEVESDRWRMVGARVIHRGGVRSR